MEQIKPYVGEPDTLLVTGFSAGGFGASLLADDVIDRFPSAQNVTVCVDSSLLLYDGWHETAVDLWQSPTEISDRLVTDNLVLDSLTALYEKRGDSVKILFDCSYRDDTLQQYQAYIRTCTMTKDKENGDNIYKILFYFDKMYEVMDKAERRHLMESLIDEIQIYEERQPNGQWLKSIKFKLPIIDEDMSLSLDKDSHIETVVRLSWKTPQADTGES